MLLSIYLLCYIYYYIKFIIVNIPDLSREQNTKHYTSLLLLFNIVYLKLWYDLYSKNVKKRNIIPNRNQNGIYSKKKLINTTRLIEPKHPVIQTWP